MDEPTQIWESRRYPGIQAEFRPDTTDRNCLIEVLEKRCYQKKSIAFDVEDGETWLDLGANIGAFALYCKARGAVSYVGYEPDADNYVLLERNLRHNDIGTNYDIRQAAVTPSNQPLIPFWKGRSPKDRYRYTPIENKTPHPAGNLPNVPAKSVFYDDEGLLVPFDGVKMDIEGSELLLMDAGWLPRCEKLVMEYHLSKDRSMANFRIRRDMLRHRWKEVHHIPSLDQDYPDDMYPGFFDRFIFCMGWKGP